MKRGLTRIVNWGQELLAEVVQPGDLVVDLTVGTGQDTLFLARQVKDHGQGIGFDIQLAALLAAEKRLCENGIEARLQQDIDAALPVRAGVDLLHRSHSELAEVVPTAPRAVIANLGYFPGGDKTVITRPDTTVASLEQVCQLLAVGGRVAVVVYPGHPGGAEEGVAVENFFSHLHDCDFHVLQIKVSNRGQSPFLCVAEKLN